MIKIRPHHILCMRAYQGNGYSEEFNINMKKVIIDVDLYNRAYNKTPDIYKDTQVELIFGLDSLCGSCPNNLGEECRSQENISRLDKKVIEIFDLKEGLYLYKELEEKVFNYMNSDFYNQICSKCEWNISMKCRDFVVTQD
ncbi:DUF1284 domain-containing protein [Metaclostridioides mangenotii]|uniref:DUF1284 domain-containing protein n=1 Tax=Metaclostridioides mangenotii TaxID=1540 RepID=UPI0028E7141F|nr:DUF1284 domain-containing protein [Clostridioides mangenotii]